MIQVSAHDATGSVRGIYNYCVADSLFTGLRGLLSFSKLRIVCDVGTPECSSSPLCHRWSRLVAVQKRRKEPLVFNFVSRYFPLDHVLLYSVFVVFVAEAERAVLIMRLSPVRRCDTFQVSLLLL